MSIHSLITPREIARLHEKWSNLYRENNDKGDSVASFIVGNQWDPAVKDARQKAAKEVLILNIALKHLNRILVDYMSVDYTLKSHPNKTVNDEQYVRNVDELLEHFILKNHNEELIAAFQQLVIRGYTVFEIVPEYFNKASYQLVPVLKNVAKPEMVFFDSDAELPTKTDARFCGKLSLVQEEILKKHYPKYRGKGVNRYQDEVFSETNKVRVYDFYFKEDEKVKFYKTGNKFKPEYKLTEYEKQNLGATEYFEKLMPVVYTCRCTDDEFLTKPQEFYGMESLPYVFVGEPIYIKQDSQYKQIVIPYLAPLIDAQQMLNNAASQIATQTTKKLERSVIVDKSGIDPKDMNTWQYFNVEPGVFPWKSVNEMGQTNQPPIVLEPSNLDASLLQMMQLSKVMIDEVMGINLSQQGSDEDNTQSGIALAQRIAQGDMVQKRFLHTFVKALNQAGQVIKEMLAALITDEFEFMLNGRSVKINEMALSSLPDNPVRQTSFERLHEEYDFTIEASPSSQLEKMRSRETYLTLARTLPPEYLPYYIDLLFENLDVNNSTEVVKRFKTMVDPALMAVGKGEITTEQYYEEMNKRAQEKEKQPDPATALVQMEAENNQMKAQLKAKELEQNFILEKDKLVMEQAKLLSSEKKEENKDAIKLLEIQARNLDKRINARG